MDIEATGIRVKAILNRLTDKHIRDADELPGDIVCSDDDGYTIRLPDGRWFELETEYDSSLISVANNPVPSTPGWSFVLLGLLTEEEHDTIYHYEKERMRIQRELRETERIIEQETSDRKLYERLKAKYEPQSAE